MHKYQKHISTFVFGLIKAYETLWLHIYTYLHIQSMMMAPIDYSWEQQCPRLFACFGSYIHNLCIMQTVGIQIRSHICEAWYEIPMPVYHGEFCKKQLIFCTHILIGSNWSYVGDHQFGYQSKCVLFSMQGVKRPYSYPLYKNSFKEIHTLILW